MGWWISNDIDEGPRNFFLKNFCLDFDSGNVESTGEDEEHGQWGMQGHCQFNEAADHGGDIPISFESKIENKPLFFSGMLNARHSSINGKWGGTPDCSDGSFSLMRSNHIEV